MLKKIALTISLTLCLAPQVQATDFEELQAYLLELLSFNEKEDTEPALQQHTTQSEQGGEVVISNRPLEGEPEWE